MFETYCRNTDEEIQENGSSIHDDSMDDDDDGDDDAACVAPKARYGTYTNRLMAIASRQRVIRDEEEAWGEDEFNQGDGGEPDEEDEAEEAWGEGEDGYGDGECDEPDYQEDEDGDGDGDGDGDEPDYQEEVEGAWGEGEFNHEDSDGGYSASSFSYNTPSLCSSIQKKKKIRIYS